MRIAIKYTIQHRPIWILFMAGFLVLASCSKLWQILQQVNIQKPQAKIEKVVVTGFTFQKVDLNFKVAIENPNPVAVKLSGFDYDLLLNGHSFLTGNQETNSQIKANETSRLDVPLSLSFNQIFKTFKSLTDADSIKYQLKTTLNVNVPVLGVVKIPISQTGYLPNLRKPDIRLKTIKLKNLSFNAAQLEVEIQIKNPNTVGFIVSKLKYNLEVNGTKWLSGLTNQPMTVKKKEQSVLSLPVTLNFLNIGMAVYNLLTGNKELEYHFTGKADFKTPISFFNTFSLPFDQKGTIPLTK